jgi:RNA exonuclease 1
MIHHRVIDTSVLYPHPQGPPAKRALRNLAQTYLSETIQTESHDSIIDAATAIKDQHWIDLF